MLWLKTLKHWGQLMNIVEPIKNMENPRNEAVFGKETKKYASFQLRHK